MPVTESTRSSGASAAANTVATRVGTAILRPLWILADQAMALHERWRQRQALMMLDDHLLKDIGVSRADAEQETTKPFWKE